MRRFTCWLLFFAFVPALAQQAAEDSGTLAAAAAGTAALPDQVQGQIQDQVQVTPEVAEAEAAIAKSDWKAAQAKLDTWLAGHATDARALFDAGYVADADNRPADAEGFYRRAIDANPKSFEAHLSLGLLLARQGKEEEARPELAVATNLDPGEAGPAVKARAWRAMARIDRPGPNHPGDAEEASNDLLQALRLSPETPDDTLMAAAIADQAGEFPAAETAYRRVLAIDPKSAEANAGLAHVLIELKRYPEAETVLRASLERSPDDPAITAELASVLAAQDKAEALPLLQKLHDAHPKDVAVTRMLAAVLADAGDFTGSDRLDTELLAATPNDAGLLLEHGQNLVRLQRYPEALTVFGKVTSLDPTNADGWSGLAFAASRANQPAVTLHALTMRSKYLKEIPSTYFLWATAYDSLHQKEQAVVYYQHFLESSAGKFPDQEWQARQRLKILAQKP